MRYPYPIREVVADAVVHVIGLTGAFTGAALLVLHLSRDAPEASHTAVFIYALFLLLALVASAAYHLVPFERPRPWLHRIDHAAIYLKIAGTYTPFVAVLGTAFSYAVLAVVWLVAIAGAIAKLSFWRTDARGSLPLYLVLGWACLLLIVPMWNTFPPAAVALITAGGLLYSAGTVVFAARAMPYQNAIWHGFVVSASTCFFAAVTLTVTA